MKQIKTLEEFLIAIEEIFGTTEPQTKPKVTVNGSNTHVSGYPIINDKTKFRVTKIFGGDKEVFKIDCSNDDFATAQVVPRRNIFDTLEQAKSHIQSIKASFAPKEVSEVVYQD